MIELILGFQWLADGVSWYFGDVFELLSDELLDICLIFASVFQELVDCFYAKILIL